MSFHGQRLRPQQSIRTISNEIIKAVDSAVCDEARPVAIVRACLKMERIPGKLRKKKGQSNLKSKTSDSLGLELTRKPDFLLLGEKRSLGKIAASQPSEVSPAVKKPFTLLLLSHKKLVCNSGTSTSRALVTDHQFPTPFGPGAAVPDPLRSNPPFTQTKPKRSLSWRRIGQRSRSVRRYAQKKAKDDSFESLILSAVAEPSDQDRQQPSGAGENVEEALQVIPRIVLADTNRMLQEENRQLNSVLHKLISERVVLVGEAANLQRDSKAMETALMVLWNLSKSQFPWIEDATSVADICNTIERLSREGAQENPPDDRGAASDSKKQQQQIASLEEQLAQQAKFLEHYKRMETAARRNVHKLSLENKKMQTQLSEAEANRQQLKARAEATEQRFRRLENHILQNTWV